MVEVSDYTDAKAKLKELGYSIPNSIIIIPYDFEKAISKRDMVYASTEVLMGKVFDLKNVKTSFLKGRRRLKPLSEIEALIFTIMIPADLDVMFPVILSLLSSHLSRCYDKDHVGINLILEQDNGKMKKVSFSGSPANLNESKKEIIDIGKKIMGSVDDPSAKIEKAQRLLDSGAITKKQFKIIKDTFSG